MHWIDWIVIALYFVLIAWIAWWYGRHQRDTTDYFLAGRNAGWVVIGASIFTSNIGSEHIVGLAGQGASTGMAMAHWELHAWCLIVLAGLFVPFYYKSRVATIPEFLEKRFSPRTRWILSCVSLVAYVFTKVSVTVYAGAVVFQALLPDTFGSPQNAFWVGAFSTVIITGIYTVFGGMRAIMNTATPQAVIILFGSFVITAIGLSKLGGWDELVATCKTNADQFALWRPLSDPDFPWLGVVIASPIIGLWYWCTDQYIVQRVLSAKDLPTARRGALFGGVLKLWPVLIFLIPGMIGWALHQKGIIQLPPKIVNGEVVAPIDGDQVFPSLVRLLLPPGIRGLIVACLLAALMSSLASLFNSSASLFTVDIYEKIRPGQSEQHLLMVGRIATATVVILGIIWIPVMAKVSGGGLYQYLQSVQGYLAPPITAVFFLGLFWKRLNSVGATWALATGFVLGMLKLTIQVFFGKEKQFQEPAWLAAIGDFNFLYATGVLFAISAIVMVVASLLTPPPPEEKVRGLTYGSIHQEAAEEIRKSWDAGNIFMALFILVCVLGMYLYFSFWLS
ncbi:sodium/solute symporter [Limisphaera ngatamarikiensis]|jgi:SSS family solute:Na+ symporter|uniref:Sodium/solute symporter n=1 Tax=Limisphaera ngatamarikiensis TaxID=1324935 RepID=A0A6M1RXP9_9BACT|nr:sodium:solute symporter [Limisphaera ngatamarikiensis]NGO40251.1 sodium/solute symporter [Limisphaera ngatamarikiensis]